MCTVEVFNHQNLFFRHNRSNGIYVQLDNATVIWLGIFNNWNYGVLHLASNKIRSIRATGVLYVMTFVFIGELIAGYYHFKYGISL